MYLSFIHLFIFIEIYFISYGRTNLVHVCCRRGIRMIPWTVLEYYPFVNMTMVPAPPKEKVLRSFCYCISFSWPYNRSSHLPPNPFRLELRRIRAGERSERFVSYEKYGNARGMASSSIRYCWSNSRSAGRKCPGGFALKIM